MFIVERILKPHLTKGTEFVFVLSAADCNVSERRSGVIKHLSLLPIPYKPNEMLLVDDNPGVRSQRAHVWTVPAFEGNPYDSILKHLSDLLIISQPFPAERPRK